MTSESALQFPLLPEDVERLVIECAAEGDSETALRLVYTCHQFQRWVDPIVYRAVTLRSGEESESFLRTLRTSKSPSFFSTHVKILTFKEGISVDHVIEITSACTSAVSLTYWARWHEQDGSPIINISPATLRRLSMDVRHLSGKTNPDFNLPTLQNITHLDIVSLRADWSTWSWDGFDSLVHLSHLFIELPDAEHLPSTVTSLLPHFPDNLRVCIVFVDSGLEFEGPFEALKHFAMGNIDSRIVLGTQYFDADSALAGIVLVRKFDRIFMDWGLSFVSEADVWEQAERIIGTRQLASHPPALLTDTELS